MSSKTRLKSWLFIHTWSSIVCTAFLFLLCVTGLPLIFNDELSHWLGYSPEAPAFIPAATDLAPDLDQLTVAAKRYRPGDVVQYIIWGKAAAQHDPIVTLITAPSPATAPDDSHTVLVDSRTALAVPTPVFTGSLMFILLKLHTDMFLGLPGKLFLGAMGLLFVASLISGVVVYGPFMQKLDFGTVRLERRSRIKWLDLHNLLGIAAATWMLIVGVTGVVSTLADVALDRWRTEQFVLMQERFGALPAVGAPGSVERAARIAKATLPDMTPSFIAFPGTRFSTPHHYTVFMRGHTTLTSRLLRPVLIDAERLTLSQATPMPWYLSSILLAQPLHFGDYGGLPLKILWALLDIAAIVVLGSGLYLWMGRRTVFVQRKKIDAS